MGSIILRVPVLPGQTDEVVEALKLLAGPLEAQNLEKAQELGVVEEHWWVVREDSDDVLYVELTAERPEAIVAAFESSDTPIAVWLRSKLKRHTCYDPERLQQVEERPSQAERIASWSLAAR